MTVRDLVTRSLRLIGVLAKGESADASDAIDALTAMNSLIDMSKNDGFLIYENQTQTVALVSSQQTYSIGDGGDFDVDRPVSISEANYVLNNIEYPIEIVSQDEWADISNKSMQGSIPAKLYYNPKFPLGEINVWPTPGASGSLKLYVPKPVDKFTSINATFELPPGYENFLVYGTADMIAPEYGKELTASQRKILSDAKAGISRQNTTPVLAEPDQTGAGSRSGMFDIVIGGYRR